MPAVGVAEDSFWQVAVAGDRWFHLTGNGCARGVDQIDERDDLQPPEHHHARHRQGASGASRAWASERERLARQASPTRVASAPPPYPTVLSRSRRLALALVRPSDRSRSSQKPSHVPGCS